MIIILAEKLHAHHMQSMFIVTDSIFEANISAIDGSGKSLDVAGVSIAI